MKELNLRDISKTIYNRSHSFSIEQEINRLSEQDLLQQRWCNNLDRAKLFARRSLEVATLAARTALVRERDLSNAIAEHEKLASLASNSAKSLHLLLHHISGKPLPGRKRHTRPEIALTDISSHLNLMHLRDELEGGKEPDPSSTREKATGEATTLLEALNLMSWLEDHGKRRRALVAGKRKKPGAPQKLAFTLPIMEAWVFLVGKKPNENNPHFAKFLDQAWSDVVPSAANEDWKHSIRKASKSITPYTEQMLKSRGPNWRLVFQ